MKRSLKLLFALSTLTTLPLSVIACQQQDLDSTLKIINDNTTTKYNIQELLGDPIDATITEKVLTEENSNILAKTIAETILNGQTIIWFDDTLNENTICYNFNIVNGKKENNNITWEVKGIDQRIEVKIEYFVGIANADKTFAAKQRITKTFYIKVGTSNSDKEVNSWINSFNGSVTTVNIDLTTRELTIPTTGGWSDLDQNVITAIYEDVTKVVPTGSVTWAIESNNKTINNGELELIIAASLNDAKANTNPFTIKFV